MERIDKIALIAGSGNFPLFLAKAAKTNGVGVTAICIISETDERIEKVVDKSYWVNLGEGKKLLSIFKDENIKHAVMAGKISKMTIIREGLRLDGEAKKVISNIMDRRDDTMLSAVANRLKEAGVELLDSTTFVSGMMPKEGVLTKRRPSREESEDIKFGFKMAKEMGRLDIGQSVVVKKKAVIAVEAIEGTDNTIKRAGELAGEGTVVVKVSKPNQDMRFDVPVVGPTTIKSLEEARSSVLAIEAGKVLLLEAEEVIREADSAGISVIAI